MDALHKSLVALIDNAAAKFRQDAEKWGNEDIRNMCLNDAADLSQIAEAASAGRFEHTVVRVMDLDTLVRDAVFDNASLELKAEIEKTGLVFFTQ